MSKKSEWFNERGGGDSDKDRAPSPSMRRLKREKKLVDSAGPYQANLAHQPANYAATPASQQPRSIIEAKLGVPSSQTNTANQANSVSQSNLVTAQRVIDQAETGSETLSSRNVEKLATRSAQGSHADFAELVRRYHERVYNFLLKRTRNPDEAADLTQEAFVRAWQRIDRYDPRWQFSTWIFTIAVRLSVSRQRREKRNIATDDLDQTRSAKGAAVHAAMEHAESINTGRALWVMAQDVLSEDQYAALWLRYAEGLSMSDIAKVIGKTQVGVRVSLFRARATLADAARRVPAFAREMEVMQLNNGRGRRSESDNESNAGARHVEPASGFHGGGR